MSRRPDITPKSIAADREYLELVFKRVLEDEGEAVWKATEKKVAFDLLDPLIAMFRKKCIELGVAGPVSAPPGKKKRPHTNGRTNGARRTA